MSSFAEQTTSAQVILGEGRCDPAAVTAAFRTLGFATGPLVGNSFSIEATSAHFERIFAVRLHQRPNGGLDVARVDGGPRDQLPTASLPVHTRTAIAYVVFTGPPDFGPGRA